MQVCSHLRASRLFKNTYPPHFDTLERPPFSSKVRFFQNENMAIASPNTLDDETGPNPYVPEVSGSPGSLEDKEANDRLDVIRTATNRSKLDRLELLSRELSTHTARDGQIRVDPADFDLVKVLRNFTSAARSQNIKLRHTGLSFSDMTLLGVDESFSLVPTVKNVLQGPYAIYKKVKMEKSTPPRAILSNFNGYARAGEMVLVLGRPGAGCLSLLKTLSGTDIDLYLGLEGDIRYDGIPQKEMLEQFRSDLVYNPELDVHFPHLTVEETLRFAIGCKTPQLRVHGATRAQYIDALKDILATVFGLRHTYHTKVGNDFVRGVSGGERKRVSIAEALACKGLVYFWDNATRGLDASTALEYTKAIRASTNLLDTTAFVTLYQAGESIYEAFDKVTVLYKGRQVYFGPVESAKAYFEEMGWECPPRQSTAEFLTAVTDPIGRTPRPGFADKVPRTAGEFEAYWHRSPQFEALKREIAEYNASVSSDETCQAFRASISQEKQVYQRMGSKYTINYLEQLKLCTVRGFQRIWNDKAYTVTQIVAAISQGLVVGSLYYNTSETVSGAFSRGGVIFFAALYVTLMSLAEVNASFSLRPILMKQKNYSMYHPLAHALSGTITLAPVALLITICFMLILYFLANLSREAGKFFTSVLFIFLLSLTMSSLFQAVSSLCKNIADANTFLGILVLATLMYTSYMIQRPSMHPWFKWISYINPLLYGFEAIIATEFHGRKMECDGSYLTPLGPGYSTTENVACAFAGAVPNQSFVSGDDYLKVAFTYKFSHVWRNLGVVIAFLVLFNIVNMLGMEYVKPISGGGDRLLFLEGKVPDSVVLPADRKVDDDESAAADVSLEKVRSGTPILEDLKSKGVFVWKDISYTIPYDGGERKLLDAISGYCVPGTLTALMGESGAGKTTLLNVLSGRTDMGIVTGDMLVNGRPLDLSFRRKTGYVQQQDIHVSESTVREALQFLARLRRPTSVSDAEKLDYVEQIIKVLDMGDYADALVGISGSGLNVEQRKKLSVGVELVAKPSLLLFLDEPTSGLDSQSAWAIVSLLKSLAAAGQSILCTIHQPSATLFEEFDRLLLLKRGGQTVYFGDIGKHSSTLLSYFERNGARHCDIRENPAEYILEAIGAGATAVTEQDWHELWANSPEATTEITKLNRLIEESLKESPLEEVDGDKLVTTYATPYWYQFPYVVRRNFTSFWRNPEYFGAKFGLMTFSGLFIGFSFFGLKHSVTGMQNALFTAFLSVVVSAPVANQLMAQAIAGRELFEGREKLSNTYHWSLMIFAQFLTEYPYLLFTAAVQFVCLYFPTQADTSPAHSGIFYFSNGVFLQAYILSFLLLLLYIAPDLETGGVLFSFFYAFIVSFSGIVQPLNLMPGFWHFMYKLSPYTYFIQNLVGSILHDRQVHCAPHELAVFLPPSGKTCGEFTQAFIDVTHGFLVNPLDTTDCQYCQYTVGDQYLSRIGAKFSYRWRNIGFFVIYVVFNMAMCLFLYWLLRFRKGRSLLSFIKRKQA